MDIQNMKNIPQMSLGCVVVVSSVTSSRWPVRLPFVFSFHFLFFKICVRKQWAIKYVILVEDSSTGSPISITVRMEYLFAFGGTKSLISIFVLGVTRRNEAAGLFQPLPSIVFNLLETFHHHRSYGRNFRIQR